MQRERDRKCPTLCEYPGKRDRFPTVTAITIPLLSLGGIAAFFKPTQSKPPEM